MNAAVATLEAVRAAVGTGAERPAEDYSIEGRLPALAVRPATREGVARALEAATSADAVVVPQGGRTAQRLGHPLERYDVALDLGALDRIVAYEPADLTVTVEGGVSLATLQARLGEAGQYLPIDPPPGDEVSIGGLLATARAGAWRGHLPNQRELILGATVALPDGTLTTSGGRVVKNVSGYDLHRLHTGALGTLGVIVEASFKVAPLPSATRALALRVPTLAGAEALAFDAWDLGLPLRALTLLTPEGAAREGLAAAVHVLLEVAGSAPAVERSLRELERTARDAAATPVDGALEVMAGLRRLAGGDAAREDREDIVLRLGVPPAEVRAVLEAVRRLVPAASAWAHLVAGSVLVHAPEGVIGASVVLDLRVLAERTGGFLAIEAGPVALRTRVDPLGGGDPTLTRALRAQLDPSRTLNRGRLGARS